MNVAFNPYFELSPEEFKALETTKQILKEAQAMVEGNRLTQYIDFNLALKQVDFILERKLV